MKILLLEDDDWLAESIIDAMRERGLDPIWCETYDGAVRASSHIGAEVCVADFDLQDPQGRTGLDFLATFDGRRVLFSGLDRDAPEDVEFVPKSDPMALLDLLAADAAR